MNPLDTPTVDPNWFGGLAPLIGGMMTPSRRNHNHNGGDDDDDTTISDIVKKWIHPSVTIGLAIFLFTQYQESGKRDAERDTRIAVLQQQIASLQALAVASEKLRDAQIDVIEKRVDVQRGNIDTLQTELLGHASRDDRVFQRKQGQ